MTTLSSKWAFTFLIFFLHDQGCGRWFYPSTPVKPHLECCKQLRDPQHRKDMDTWSESRGGTSRWSERGWGNWVCSKREGLQVIESWLPSTWRLLARKMERNYLQEHPVSRTRGNGFKLKEGRSEALEEVARRSCEYARCVQCRVERAFAQPGPVNAAPVMAGESGLGNRKVPFSLTHSGILWFYDIGILNF